MAEMESGDSSRYWGMYEHSSTIGPGPMPGGYVALGDMRYIPLQLATHEVGDHEPSLAGGIESVLNQFREAGRACGIKSIEPFGKIHPLVLLTIYDFETLRAATLRGVESVRMLTFRLPVRVTYHDHVKVGVGKKTKSVFAYIDLFPFHRTIPGVLTSKENRGLNAQIADIHVPRNQAAASNLSSNELRATRVKSIHVEEILGFNRIDSRRRCKRASKDEQATASIREAAAVAKAQAVLEQNLGKRPKTALTLVATVGEKLGNQLERRRDVLLEIATRKRDTEVCLRSKRGATELLKATKFLEQMTQETAKRRAKSEPMEHAPSECACSGSSCCEESIDNFVDWSPQEESWLELVEELESIHSGSKQNRSNAKRKKKRKASPNRDGAAETEVTKEVRLEYILTLRR